MFAIVDCNNFYASCERAFKPNLEGKPVVILSNNDGCIIARSNEAKALGIMMGAPYFQFKEVMQKNSVNVFSSNYELYGDMSARVMEVLLNEVPELEVYSVDEAFVNVRGIQDYMEFSRKLRSIVKRYTAIPVSIGIAPTKTLAKMANNIAKKNPKYNGVFALDTPEKVMHALETFPLEDVWGIGRALRKKLMDIGIVTPLHYASMPDPWLKKHFTVVGMRTAWELRGTPCISMNQAPPSKKGISVTRCFSMRLTCYNDIMEALMTHTARACEKLREERVLARYLRVFIHTSKFTEVEKYYYHGVGLKLPMAMNDTQQVMRFTRIASLSLFKSGYRYSKGGIEFTDLCPEGKENLDLLLPPQPETNKRLMKEIDKINKHYGRNTVFYAGMGFERTWKTARNFCSGRPTTRIDEIINV